MRFIKRSAIGVPKGDGRKIVATARDCDGDEVDISSATEIALIVSTGQKESSNMVSGGTILITKKLGSGITRAGNPYQFIITFNPSDTADLIYSEYYWEACVVMGDMPVTVGCGSFFTQNTQVRDIL